MVDAQSLAVVLPRTALASDKTNYHKAAGLWLGFSNQPAKAPHKTLRGPTLSIFAEEDVSANGEEEWAVPVQVQLRYLLNDPLDLGAWKGPGAIGRPELEKNLATIVFLTRRLGER